MTYINLENIPHCSQCGGSVDKNFKCMFCGYEKHKILEIIKPECNIEIYFKKLYTRILNGASTKHDEKNLLYLMNNNMIENFEVIIQNIIIDRILNKKINISLDTFEKMLCYYVINVMRKLDNIIKQPNDKKRKTHDFNCEIVEFSTSLDGLCLNEYVDINKTHHNINIKLNKQVISDFFNTGNKNALITIFHEIRHTAQNIRINNGLISGGIINQIKEKIIIRYEKDKYNTNTFYTNNYLNLISEYDAELKAMNLLIGLLSTFEIPIPQEIIDELNNLKKNPPNFKMKKIIINGQEKYITLGDVFEKIIQEVPDYLELYPQLKLEYINDNGVVRRKTIKELEDSLDEFEDDIEKEEKIAYITELIEILRQKKK